MESINIFHQLRNTTVILFYYICSRMIYISQVVPSLKMRDKISLTFLLSCLPSTIVDIFLCRLLHLLTDISYLATTNNTYFYCCWPPKIVIISEFDGNDLDWNTFQASGSNIHVISQVYLAFHPSTISWLAAYTQTIKNKWCLGQHCNKWID